MIIFIPAIPLYEKKLLYLLYSVSLTVVSIAVRSITAILYKADPAPYHKNEHRFITMDFRLAGRRFLDNSRLTADDLIPCFQKLNKT